MKDLKKRLREKGKHKLKRSEDETCPDLFTGWLLYEAADSIEELEECVSEKSSEIDRLMKIIADENRTIIRLELELETANEPGATDRITELEAKLKHHKEMERVWKANAEALAEIANAAEEENAVLRVLAEVEDE